MKKICLVLGMVVLGLGAIGAETSKNAAQSVSSTNEVVRCEAITKSGNQCKRRAQSGKKLCRQHEKLAEKKAKGAVK